MEAYALDHGAGEPRAEELECDCELPLASITARFLNALERLAPFGNGNDEPLWMSCGVRLAAAPRVIGGKHLRLRLEDETGAGFNAVAWTRRTNWAEKAAAEGWVQGEQLDVMYRLRRNWNPSFEGWEMDLTGMRRSDTADAGV
jgi:single-stranded-DNA-specific exonuclease